MVGAPRSGTTLLAAILGSHSRIACGPETDFFHFLRQVDPADLTDPDTWPERGTGFLFDMVQAANKAAVPYNYGLTPGDVAEYLRARGPSIPVLLEALTRQDAERQGKVRWVEKTPRHLLHLAAIRHYYPNAPVIRIVRDPRDAALSLIRAPWAWAPRTLFPALRLWEYCEERSRTQVENDPNACTVRYEDLLERPAHEISRLCRFIGEAYEPAMLDTREAAQFANGAQEPWKAKVSEALDRSRVAVWRRVLRMAERHLAELTVGHHLRRYGYESGPPPGRYGTFLPSRSLDRFPSLGPWLESRAVRQWPQARGERPQVRVLLGDPEEEGWLGRDAVRRLGNVARILFGTLFERARGASVYWLLGEPPRRDGLARRVLGRLRAVAEVQVIAPVAENERTWWRKSLERNPRLGQFGPTSNRSPRARARMAG